MRLFSPVMLGIKLKVLKHTIIVHYWYLYRSYVFCRKSYFYMPSNSHGDYPRYSNSRDDYLFCLSLARMSVIRTTGRASGERTSATWSVSMFRLAQTHWSRVSWDIQCTINRHVPDSFTYTSKTIRYIYLMLYNWTARFGAVNHTVSQAGASVSPCLLNTLTVMFQQLFTLISVYVSDPSWRDQRTVCGQLSTKWSHKWLTKYYISLLFIMIRLLCLVSLCLSWAKLSSHVTFIILYVIFTNLHVCCSGARGCVYQLYMLGVGEPAGDRIDKTEAVLDTATCCRGWGLFACFQYKYYLLVSCS